MGLKIGNWILYQYKKMQYAAATWKKSREIALAYRTPRQWSLRSPPVLTAGIIGILCMLGACLYWARPLIRRAIAVFPGPELRSPAPAVAPSPLETQDAVPRRGTGTEKPEDAAMKKPPSPSSVDGVFDLPPELRYVVVADKKNRILHLIKKDRGWRPVSTYSIAVGEARGQKKTEGDRKTPEGTYFIIGVKTDDELQPIYGPCAYILNYPNEEDRKANRSGQGIWIHGTHPDSVPRTTRGCIEMNNRDLLEVAGHIHGGIGTPVIISPSLPSDDPLSVLDSSRLRRMRRHALERYRNVRNEFVAILEKWENAWESRNINRYGRFYSVDRFSSRGMNWEQWITRKKGIFDNATRITVVLDNILLSDVSESTAVLRFAQRYESDRFEAINNKKLTFFKENDEWKIIRENSLAKGEFLL